MKKKKAETKKGAQNSKRGKTKAGNSRIKKRLEDEQRGWRTKDGWKIPSWEENI